MKLLIVDDEEIIRRGLLMLDWESFGITEVFAAEDGLQARDILQEHHIGIVVSDIKMPGLNGLELAEYISIHSMRTRTILLTGFDDFSLAQTAIRTGVTDYLLKPIDPKQLLESVGREVEYYRLSEKTDKILRNYEEDYKHIDLQKQVLHVFRNVRPDIRSLLQYITVHYADGISFSELAKEYHFNIEHFSRKIKKETGFSFLELLTCIRLMNAAQLLREREMKVNLVCEQVGFNDQRYFSQVFKRVFGCTPVEYKKQEIEPKRYEILEFLEKMKKNKQEVI